MKNYTDNDYALNKVNKEAIVYRFADEIVEVTIEDYLRENPDKTAADFAELKVLSDEDYKERDREDYRLTYKNVSLHGLDETEACCVPSPEEILFDEPERKAQKERMRRQAYEAIATLTEVQRRRYIQHHVEGLSVRDIADMEKSHFTSVHESLLAAEKKIKKYLAND
mgnify:CR=1 FL=1